MSKCLPTETVQHIFVKRSMNSLVERGFLKQKHQSHPSCLSYVPIREGDCAPECPHMESNQRGHVGLTGNQTFMGSWGAAPTWGVHTQRLEWSKVNFRDTNWSSLQRRGTEAEGWCLSPQEGMAAPITLGPWLLSKGSGVFNTVCSLRLPQQSFQMHLLCLESQELSEATSFLGTCGLQEGKLFSWEVTSQPQAQAKERTIFLRTPPPCLLLPPLCPTKDVEVWTQTGCQWRQVFPWCLLKILSTSCRFGFNKPVEFSGESSSSSSLYHHSPALFKHVSILSCCIPDPPSALHHPYSSASTCLVPLSILRRISLFSQIPLWLPISISAFKAQEVPAIDTGGGMRGRCQERREAVAVYSWAPWQPTK